MSNLPPGVTDSMIPGNTPEDLAYERFREALSDLLASFGYTDDEVIGAYETEDRLADELWTLVQATRREG